MGKQSGRSAAGRCGESTREGAENYGGRRGATFTARDVITRADACAGGSAARMRPGAPRDARAGDRRPRQENRGPRGELVGVAATIALARRRSSIQSAAAIGELLERESIGDELELDFRFTLHAC